MTKGDTFLRITNRDIFNKMEAMEKALSDSIKINNEGHEAIVKHLTITNGKVKLNRWISTTAITLVLMVFGLLIKFS